MKYYILGFLSFLMAIALVGLSAPPSQAHWADLAAAEIIMGNTKVQMTLTFPTGLMPFADDNRDGQLASEEVGRHLTDLQERFNQSIRLTDSENRPAILTLEPVEGAALSPSALAAPNSHSTLRLNYTWKAPVQGITLHYGLFLPGVPTATCLATILQDGHLRTFVFTPKAQQLALTTGGALMAGGEILLALVGAFLWGATHSLSPGHGKTLVGAYLVGERATPLHALFLAMTTTITHTIGIFALGLVTLFAARYILPEQLYPWISLLSGVAVVGIGINLFIHRLKKSRPHSHPHHETPDRHNHQHHHSEHRHSHDHSDDHGCADHQHEHTHHGHHSHSLHTHLPPGADGSAVTWRSLLALGISGGLIPCPAALVLLLSAIALGNVALGLLLVLAFSLGLALVLTSLGLLLVYAKQIFKQVPAPKRLTRILPVLSAVGITVIGLGMSVNAVMQIGFSS